MSPGRSKEATEDWWERRIGILQEIAEPLLKRAPDQVYEKRGFWPIIKLVFMQISLGFYIPLVRKSVDRLQFIDLNAGSGVTRVRSRFRNNASVTVAGTAAIGARIYQEKYFDELHLVEPLSGPYAGLTDRLDLLACDRPTETYPETVETAAPKIANAIENADDSSHFMAFVDPEGLTELTLEHLEPLLALDGDFVFNFQYQGAVRHKPSASSFLGIEVPDGASWDDVKDMFLAALRDCGLTKAGVVPVRAGGDLNYAYDVIWASKRTFLNNPWLDNYQRLVDERISGYDAATIDNMVFPVNQSLADFLPDGSGET